MATISYYFAVSLNGYIARQNGSVDWLDPYFCKFDTPYDFDHYIKTVSTVIMGRKTLDKCVALGPLPFTQPGFVYTKNSDYKVCVDGVTIVSSDVREHVQNLKQTQEGRIWLLGGGAFAAFLLKCGLLDELVMSIMPVVIDRGIPWMSNGFLQDGIFSLKEHYTAPNGIVQLVYGR